MNVPSDPRLYSKSKLIKLSDDLVSPTDQGTIPGYYYYFYPIKSFMPNATGDTNSSAHDMMMMMMDGQDMADDNKDNRIDPLFLAVAGFVSMATIVSFSILFLPKFGDHRSHDKASLKVQNVGFCLATNFKTTMFSVSHNCKCLVELDCKDFK